MTNNFTSQEILLVINSKFAGEEYIPKDDEKETPRTHAENLTDACWNGLVGERLPEINITDNKKSLPLWEVSEGCGILYLKLGERDASPEAEFTINPYKLKAHCSLN